MPSGVNLPVGAWGMVGWNGNPAVDAWKRSGVSPIDAWVMFGRDSNPPLFSNRVADFLHMLCPVYNLASGNFK